MMEVCGMVEEGKKYWIWYPGDFELYHGMKQNFSRVERGYGWPAYWKSEPFHHRVVFRRNYVLSEKTQFYVFSKAIGHVLVGDKKYPFGQRISCEPGEIKISIHAGCVEAFPSVYIEGEQIYSDSDWMADDYEHPPVQAGHSKYFTAVSQNPAEWEYKEKVYEPIEEISCRGGMLYAFETELNAVLQVEIQRKTKNEAEPKAACEPIRIYCGESKEEALDVEHCYYSWCPDPQTGKCPCCAVRFAYIPHCRQGEIKLKAIHQYIDIPVKADFHCSDSLLNEIWSVSEHTFRLCSGVFFIDGAKRDKWIWSGDTYQNLFVNRYLLADAEIEQRTLVALRGNDPVTSHINTIVDYSLLWILGIMEHVSSYGDMQFLRAVYPKMKSMMEFCHARTDEHGFLLGKEKDWVYIDWADIEKEGPVCAEQMLYAACCRAMENVSTLLGEDGLRYQEEYIKIKENITRFFWDEEKGAYVDSFVSGTKHVTRHANIFAILFDIASDTQQAEILNNVIENPKIPQITTPYFKFFEMEMLCRKQRFSQVMEQIKAYWGGMLKLGAVTFWEEYDPLVPIEKQYDMYGDHFGKSLCHAWAASPIYFLSRYYIGLDIDAKTSGFRLTPQLSYFKNLNCTLPIGEHDRIEIVWDGSVLKMKTTAENGRLYLENKKIELPKDQMIQLKISDFL